MKTLCILNRLILIGPYLEFFRGGGIILGMYVYKRPYKNASKFIYMYFVVFYKLNRTFGQGRGPKPDNILHPGCFVLVVLFQGSCKKTLQNALKFVYLHFLSFLFVEFRLWAMGDGFYELKTGKPFTLDTFLSFYLTKHSCLIILYCAFALKLLQVYIY